MEMGFAVWCPAEDIESSGDFKLVAAITKESDLGVDAASDMLQEFIEFLDRAGYLDCIVGAKLATDGAPVLVVYLRAEVHWQSPYAEEVASLLLRYCACTRGYFGLSMVADSPVLGYVDA